MRLSELRWLAQQDHPVWGGHLERGEPIPADLEADMGAGWIKHVGNGYAITSKGRTHLERHDICPACGQRLHKQPD